MEVKLSPQAVKYLNRINEPIKGRIENALLNLAQEPPRGDIKVLKNRTGYRLRVGDYRVLFGIADGKIVVTNIVPRGQAYKGGN